MPIKVKKGPHETAAPPPPARELEDAYLAHALAQRIAGELAMRQPWLAGTWVPVWPAQPR